MKNKNQSGFSLIELLLVIVILGTLIAIAAPSLLRARATAENKSMRAIMRTIATLQVKYYQQNRRFARLDELNALEDGNIGTISGSELIRGNFSFEMSPSPTPTDEEITNVFAVRAYRHILTGETPYELFVDQSGVITPEE